jgi:hypothetical protein
VILILAAALWLVAFAFAVARAVVPSRARGTAILEQARQATDHAEVRDLLVIGFIGAGTALFFWRLLAGQVWMPAGGGDLAQFLYPTFSFAAEWWRRGVAPLWNPYLFAGAPFVGDIQSGIFYPFYLLTFFLSSPLTFRDMEYLSVLHFFIAGAGMYAFLVHGRLGVGGRPLMRGAALAGAVAFEFSDLFVTHFGNLNLIAAAAWMPWVLLFYRRAVTDRRALYAVAAGASLALAFLAGHIQSFLFVVMTLVLLAIYHAIEGSGFRRPAIYPLLLLLLAAVTALGLSAPTLLPAVEMAQRTVRADFPYEQAARFSLPPAQLVGMLIPGFFGRGPQNAWGPWDRVEVGYLGILPLLLAGLALILRKDTLTRFLGLLALLGLGLALGGYAILHGWLYEFVPGFGQLRAPARFIVVMDLALAMLAAFGFDYLLHLEVPGGEKTLERILRALPWAFLLVALATGASAFTILILGQGQDPALFNRMANAVNAMAFFILLLALAIVSILARGTQFVRREVWAVLALGLIFFDLYSLGAYVDVSTDDPTRVFDHADAVAFLKSDADLYRVDPRGTGVDNSWPADTSILYGLFDIHGDNPLTLADLDRYWQSLGSRSAALYDLLNAKYLIGRKGVPLDRDKFRLAFDGDPALDIFENTRALPRAFMVFDKQSVADANSALSAIHDPNFDPAQLVILEQAIGMGGPDGISSGPKTAAVRIVGYGPNDIRLETDSTAPGILVLSEVYYPGWRAWVDDREAQVLRADFLFRALPVEAGSHRVRLLYDPLSFKIGEGIFGVTALAIGGWGAWEMRKSRHRQRDQKREPVVSRQDNRFSF